MTADKGLTYYIHMEEKNKKVQPGWLIPSKVKDIFSAFCTDMGVVAQEDCAGALMLWTYLPAEIRELARLEAKGLREPDLEFWSHFAAGLRLGIADRRAGLHKKQPEGEIGKV